ncbi:DUF805 domain-containing protein [Jiella sp. MQZ9-1]|uniref:DUF805 domain-containing protein n=1 Tax=Jiella flava TaxID=2816857 RepID=A0A939JUA8_9HYPH|nr:DUF805 domain-containing protein [Jiella flava]MBO0662990.1 DUF805 domain-containing protein [Jiella flava]MCD2471251.1 DUF805 domain-containing protein [Jiella flava]
MSVLLQPYKRYFEFSGRSRRLEYWLAQLTFLAGIFLFTTIDNIAGLGGSNRTTTDTTNGLRFSVHANGGLLTALWFLFTITPMIAITVRRLHDTNRSGFWMFISLIPIIGSIWFLVLMCLNGTVGNNRFGQDPKDRLGPGAEAVFE